MNIGKKKLLCLLLIAMMALAVGCSSTPQEKRQKFIAKGNTLFAQGKHVKASLEFRNAIQVDPEYPESYYLAGQAELNQGKMQEAYGFFMKTVERQADHPGANLQLGKLFLASREFVKAREKAELVLGKEPDNQQALLLQGAILLGERKAVQAKELLEKLLPRNEKEVDLYLLLATAYRQLNDLTSTEAILQKGSTQNPQSIQLCLARANFYSEQKQPGRVEEMLKKIIALEPGKPEHVVMLASFLWHEGRKTDAEALLQGILAKEKDVEERWAEVAAFYLSRQQLDKGKELLLAGLRQNKKSFRLRFLLKEAFLVKGEVGKAIAVLQECLTLDKDNPAYVLAQRGLAELYFRVGNIDEAEGYVAAVLKKSPNDVDGHLLKGAILALKGEFEQAIAEYRVVLQARPRDIHLYPRLADVMVRNRQNNLAIDMLRQGLQVAPDSAEVHRALARLYVIEKKPKDAESQLLKMVDLRPEDLAAKIDLADFYLANDGQVKAMQLYKMVIAKIPENPLGYVKLSSLYAMTKQGDEAAATVAAGLAANPGNNFLLEHGARLYVQLGRIGEALALTEQRIHRHPDDVFAYNLQGEIHLAKKDFASAEQDYRKAMALDGNLPETAVRLAQVLVLAGKGEQAIGETEKLLATPSSSPLLFILLAELYEQTKRHDQALAVYDRGLRKYPENWFIMNNIAYFIADGKNPQPQDLTKAESLVKKAQVLAPGNMAVLDTLGWLSFKMGKTVQARAALAMALTSNPNNPVFNYHLGMVLLKDGKKEEARSLLEKVVRSPGSFGERNAAEKILKGLT